MKIINKILGFIFVVGMVLTTNLYVFKIVNNNENVRKNVEKMEYAKNNKNFLYQFFKELGEYEVVNIDKKVDDFIVDSINNKDVVIDREYLKDKLKLEKVDKHFYEKTEVENKLTKQLQRYKVGIFKIIDKFDLKEITITIITLLILMFIIYLILNKSVSKAFSNIAIVFFTTFIINLLITFIPLFISFVGNISAVYLNNLFMMYSEYMKEVTFYILISLIFLMILLVVLYFMNLYKIKKKGIVTEDNFLDKYEEKPKDLVDVEIKKEQQLEELKIEEKPKVKRKSKEKK